MWRDVTSVCYMNNDTGIEVSNSDDMGKVYGEWDECDGEVDCTEV